MAMEQKRGIAAVALGLLLCTYSCGYSESGNMQPREEQVENVDSLGNPDETVKTGEAEMPELVFEVQADGKVVPHNQKPFPMADFKEHVVGSGWEYVEGHLIEADGSVEEEEFFDMVAGEAPLGYYFGSENGVTLYLDLDAIPGMFYWNVPCSYDEEHNLLTLEMGGDNSLTVVGYDEEKAVLTVVYSQWVLYPQRYRSLLQHYRRMTPDELLVARANYATDYETLRE